MNVVFFHLDTSACSWYRIVQFAENMKNVEGFTTAYPKFDTECHEQDHRPYELEPLEHVEKLDALFQMADVVVCQCVKSLDFLKFLKAGKDKHGFTLLMEADDDPFNIDGSHPNFKYIGFGSEIEKNAGLQRSISDGAIVTTDYLAQSFRNYMKNVFVVPNALDLNIWNFKPKKTEKEVILGWSGASGHDKDLSLIEPVFKQLLDEIPYLKIKCLHGSNKMGIKHERFINDLTWTRIADYPNKLCNMGFDVGVAPLWDSEFNRSKSNLRYLEYSALHIPTVASSVQPYRGTIEDGVDGFLASSRKDFLDKIKMLVYDLELRTDIAANAYKKVTENYNLNKVTNDYSDILRTFDKQKGQDVNIPRTTE